MNPTLCDYAPPGEYVKDHTIVRPNGLYHLFSISGTRGCYHGYNGNEETISWSTSRDLVQWEFRGHVLHAAQRAGAFDQHEIWAPYCVEAGGRFFLFYTGVVHPHRPFEERRLGSRSSLGEQGPPRNPGSRRLSRSHLLGNLLARGGGLRQRSGRPDDSTKGVDENWPRFVEV